MDRYIAIPKEQLNKWFIMLNMSGNNTKQAVAREIDSILKESTQEVAKGQIQAKINNNNEMEI